MQIRQPSQPDQSCSGKSGNPSQPDQSCSGKSGTPSQPDQSCPGKSSKPLSLINPAQANQAIRQTKEICEKSSWTCTVLTMEFWSCILLPLDSLKNKIPNNGTVACIMSNHRTVEVQPSDGWT